jgi:hypothetical protein
MGTVQSVMLNLPVAEAKRFKKLKDDEKDILAMFLASWLSDDNDKIDMKAIMDFIGYRAQQRGLTEEIFNEIMNEEHP